jgi:hypothetical protein
MFVKHMENEIPNAKCSVKTGERRLRFSTIPVSIMMYSYSLFLPIDVHDKSRENVVVVVGLGKLQEHLG